MFGTSYHMGGRPVSDSTKGQLKHHLTTNRLWSWSGTRMAMLLNIWKNILLRIGRCLLVPSPQDHKCCIAQSVCSRSVTLLEDWITCTTPWTRPLSMVIWREWVSSGLGHYYLSNGHFKNNVLITDTYHAVLTDFGLSQVIEDLIGPSGNTTSMCQGTVRWMAPELVLDDENNEMLRLTFGSDVWSFGCTAYEVCLRCITGRQKSHKMLFYLAIDRQVTIPRPTAWFCGHTWYHAWL